MSGAFHARLAAAQRSTEAALERLLAGLSDGAESRPARLIEAMRYAALSPGKRLRPFLLIETAALFGADGPSTIDCAASLECIHAYSLVHDDLPAMDDDDLRRGRPTVHRAFDEATAILAGDGLLTLAFEVVADAAIAPEARIELVGLLARAAGAAGMVGGQSLDLAAERAVTDEPAIRRLQAMKTGALLRFACEAGAVLGAASPEDRRRLRHFGETLGAGFQIADDLLDVTATAEATGKATAKDAGRGKATLVSSRGIEGARSELERLTASAVDLLAPFGERAEILRAAAAYFGRRES